LRIPVRYTERCVDEPPIDDSDPQGSPPSHHDFYQLSFTRLRQDTLQLAAERNGEATAP